MKSFPPPPQALCLDVSEGAEQSVTYTSFISEELLSSVTRLSTLPGSGLKQGWSGFRVLPSSGMHVCSQVSKKGVSPEGLGSDKIT